ncbi:MAG TPA: RNA pseudouridine synthase [Bacillota bacterium]|nr:RNA pseudouridine synthase [Bacillota bacterium]
MKLQPLEILYEDNHLLVVVKPVNVPVQSDQSGDVDLLSLIKADLKERYQKPGNVFVGLVHRLDRPVGGVMVFAKTSKGAARLSEQIRNHEFKKEYYAVVRGTPVHQSGCLTHYLKKDNASNTVKVVEAADPQGKQAVLDYQVRETVDGLSLVRINLQTGRAHQIRVQFATVGTPLYGDQKYGQRINRPGEQIALWAARIKFKHPTRPEPMVFSSNPPCNDYPWGLYNFKD